MKSNLCTFSEHAGLAISLLTAGLLTACGGGGGSSNVIPSQPNPNSTSILGKPVTGTAKAGISISAVYSNDSQNVTTLSNAQVDQNFTLSTTGTLGTSAANGNVTAITINGLNTSVSGNSLNITNGVATASGITQEIFNLTNETFAEVFTGEDGLLEKRINAATGFFDGELDFEYLTFGDWQQCNGNRCSLNENAADTTGVIGAFVYGDATNLSNIPTIGNAVYTGLAVGLATNSLNPGGEFTFALVDAEVSFANRTVNFSTENFGDTSRDMNGLLSYSQGSNRFSGNVTTTGGGAGTVNGLFFGPTAQEIGGVFGVVTGTDTHSGNFAAKQGAAN